MIGFLKIFLFVFMKQILFLIVFSFSASINFDGNGDGPVELLALPITLLIIYLILYFRYFNKICTKMNLGNNLFDLYYFISWIIIGILITYLSITDSWLGDILPKSSGLLGGVEYIFVPILLIIYLLIYGSIKLSIYLLPRLKKNKITKKS